MLIKTTRGQYINLEHVREISFRRSKDSYECQAIFEYSNGENGEATVYNTAVDRVDNLLYPAQLIPAQPGYMLLWFFDNDSKPDTDRWPIIAWHLDIELGFHTAITLWNSLSDSADKTAILCPDGRVIEPGNATYPDEASWIEEKQKEDERAEAARAIREAKQKLTETH